MLKADAVKESVLAKQALYVERGCSIAARLL